jgi:hypothetical protein
MLLYFLLEAVLGAPQMVTKIALKTNPELETFGSDGIHMKWHEEHGLLDVYFGEAKLYQDIGDAATKAVTSIEGFHENDMDRFELRMVTSHFKHADGETKEAVLNGSIAPHRSRAAGSTTHVFLATIGTHARSCQAARWTR